MKTLFALLLLLLPTFAFAGNSRVVFENFLHRERASGGEINQFLLNPPDAEDLSYFLHYLETHPEPATLLSELAASKVAQYAARMQWSYEGFEHNWTEIAAERRSTGNRQLQLLSQVDPSPEIGLTIDEYTLKRTYNKNIKIQEYIPTFDILADRAPRFVAVSEEDVALALKILQLRNSNGGISENSRTAITNLLGNVEWANNEIEEQLLTAAELASDEKARVSLSHILEGHFVSPSNWKADFFETKPNAKAYFRNLHGDPFETRLKKLFIRNVSVKNSEDREWAIRSFRELGYWDADIASTLMSAIESKSQGATFALGYAFRANPALIDGVQDRLASYLGRLTNNDEIRDTINLINDANKLNFSFNRESAVRSLLQLHERLVNEQLYETKWYFVANIRSLEIAIDQSTVKTLPPYTIKKEVVDFMIRMNNDMVAKQVALPEWDLDLIKNYARLNNQAALEYIVRNASLFMPTTPTAAETSIEFNCKEGIHNKE